MLEVIKRAWCSVFHKAHHRRLKQRGRSYTAQCRKCGRQVVGLDRE